MRPPVQVSLGCHVKGFAQPHADPSDSLTALSGVLKRVASRQTNVDDNELNRFGDFVQKFLHKELIPLASDTLIDRENWLAQTAYPEWRKEEIRQADEKHGTIWVHVGKTLHCKEFMKDEVYDQYKYPRLINARPDKAKAFFGPFTKEIEKEVYKSPWFIKKISVADRPGYIYERLYVQGACYAQTDFVTFEASFKEKLMQVCEVALYKYMCQHLPGVAELCEFLDYITHSNVCVHRDYRVKMKATRMSGEMSTSLANSFTNLMLFLYAASGGVYERVSDTVVSGVVEGDDGLFTIVGTPPSREVFARLGFNIELVMYQRLEIASFCGLVFDLVDKVVVCDPRDVLVRFGWTTQQYASSGSKCCRTLLRAKALSLAWQFPGCPILSSLAQYAIRVTRDVSRRVKRFINRHRMNEWYRIKFLEAYEHRHVLSIKTPPRGTRLLVEDLYGVLVEDQLRIERYLDGLDTLEVLDHPSILGVMRPVWREYYDRYSWWADAGAQLRDPPHSWHYGPDRKVVWDAVASLTTG